MFLRRFLPKNRQAEANRSSMPVRVEDILPAYTSNITMAPTHTLPGRDSVREPEETESSLRLTDALVATRSPNYSKRPSGTFKFSSDFSFV
jgi:hypothetical protein